MKKESKFEINMQQSYRVIKFPIICLLCVLYVGCYLTEEDLSLNKGSTSSQRIIDDAITSIDGTRCHLGDNLVPYTELFSPDSYTVNESGTEVTHNVTGETMPVAIFRGTCEDGETIVQVMKKDGVIEWIEIRPRSDDESNTFWMRENGTDQYSIFTDSDIELQLLGLESSESMTPPGVGNLQLANDERLVQFNTCNYRAHDKSSDECTCYNTIDVAMVYDSEFCSNYPSRASAELALQTVVASASIYYENDMCIQLRLDRIVTPEISCNANPSFFRDFHRDKICDSQNLGIPNFLRSFRDYMVDGGRDALHISESVSAVHIFECVPLAQPI